MTNLVDLVRDAASHYARPREQIVRRDDPTAVKRNPWVKCPNCYRRNPYLCMDADDDAEPCGLGIRCGCCTGPHTAPPEGNR